MITKHRKSQHPLALTEPTNSLSLYSSLSALTCANVIPLFIIIICSIYCFRISRAKRLKYFLILMASFATNWTISLAILMASSTGIMFIPSLAIAFSSSIPLSLLVPSSPFTLLDFVFVLRACGCGLLLVLVCLWQQCKLKIQLLLQQTQRQPLLQLPVELLLIMHRVRFSLLLPLSCA